MSVHNLIQDFLAEDLLIVNEPTTESVANMVAGIPEIGRACDVLVQSGLEARIVANKIAVNGILEAHLVNSRGHSWWTILSIDGSAPSWTVGTRHDDPANWEGEVA